VRLINWTKEQQQAITSSGDLLISAAAGSGKTAVLVQHIIEKITVLVQGSLNDFLMITFSNAAAAEMKARIWQQLNQKLQEEPSDWLQAQLQCCATANISTFHAFFLKVIREAALPGMGGEYQVASDYELTILKKKAFANALEEICSCEDRAQIAVINEFSLGSKKLFRNIKKLYEFARSKPFYLNFLDSICESYNMPMQSFEKDPFVRIIFQYAEELVKYCIKQTRYMQGLANSSQRHQRVLQNDLQNFSKLLHEILKKDLDAVRQNVNLFFEPLPAAKKGLDLETQQQISNIRKRVKTRITFLKTRLFCFDRQSFLEDRIYSAKYFESLVRATKIFDKCLQALKHKYNLIDFEDIEQMALSFFLRNNSRETTLFAANFAKQFKEILVDEYQDINEIQNLILNAISNNNLFVVGDVKQSIYGFRHATPEFFLAKVESLPNYDGQYFPAKLSLRHNFRSSKVLVDAINFIFKRLMTEDILGFCYDQTHELIAADFAPTNSGFELNVIEVSGSSEELVQIEAEHVAVEISKRVKDPNYLISNGGSFRRARYGDFCVLFRSLEGKLDYYLDVFSKHKIPVNAQSFANFFNQKEIQLLCSLLKVINNPTSEIDLVAVMNSYFFEFTLSEILELKSEEGSSSLYEKVVCAADKKSKILISVIDSCRQIADSVVISDLLNYIYFDLRFFSLAVACSSAPHAVKRNLELFLDLVKYSKCESLQAFVVFLAAIAKNPPTSFFGSESVANDSVNILSIHKSKGLEFPVCFLADVSKEFNKVDLSSPILLHSKLKAACTKYPHFLQPQPTIFKAAVALVLQKEMIAEEIRLLYVALTRARTTIIVPIVTKDISDKLTRLLEDRPPLDFVTLQKHQNYLDLLLLALLSDAGFCKQMGVSATEVIGTAGVKVNFVNPCELQIQTTEKPDLPVNVMTQIEKNLAFASSFAIDSFPVRLSVSELLELQKPQVGFERIPRFLSETNLFGKEHGIALHKFLQLCDYKVAAVDLRGELLRLVKAGKFTNVSFLESDIESLLGFFRSDFYKKVVCNAIDIQREVRFAANLSLKQLALGSDSEKFINVHGIVDCVLEFEKEIYLLDFKSSQIFSPDILAQRYQQQLHIYKLAVSGAYEKPVTKQIIYSLPLQKEIYV
jgi:ATP-dependent helicase/nuclease subunit A